MNGSDRVALLDLDYSRTKVRVRGWRVKIGPVGTTLTQGAADALNQAFGVSALTDDTVLGDATVALPAVPPLGILGGTGGGKEVAARAVREGCLRLAGGRVGSSDARERQPRSV